MCPYTDPHLGGTNTYVYACPVTGCGYTSSWNTQAEADKDGRDHQRTVHGA